MNEAIAKKQTHPIVRGVYEMKPRPVLLLCSYCGDDNPNCSSDLPCLVCLKMCNAATMIGPVVANHGGWDYLTDIRERQPKQ